MKKAICILLTVLTLVSTAVMALADSQFIITYDPDKVPYYSPLWTTQIGEVYIEAGTYGDRKILMQTADPKSKQVDVVYPGRIYPCYGVTQGTTHKPWYYIWVPEDDVWGWASSAYSFLVEFPQNP